MAIESSDIVAVARSWIGTPYVHQASLKGHGCDCLGLLRGVWRELGNQEMEILPPYSPDWAESRSQEHFYEGLKRHFCEIGRFEIAPGDIALFRMRRGAPGKHCAIVAERMDGLTLIHTRQNKRVSEETLSRFWRRHLMAAFRISQS